MTEKEWAKLLERENKAMKQFNVDLEALMKESVNVPKDELNPDSLRKGTLELFKAAKEIAFKHALFKRMTKFSIEDINADCKELIKHLTSTVKFAFSVGIKAGAE